MKNAIFKIKIFFTKSQRYFFIWEQKIGNKITFYTGLKCFKLTSTDSSEQANSSTRTSLVFGVLL